MSMSTGNPLRDKANKLEDDIKTLENQAQNAKVMAELTATRKELLKQLGIIQDLGQGSVADKIRMGKLSAQISTQNSGATKLTSSKSDVGGRRDAVKRSGAVGATAKRDADDNSSQGSKKPKGLAARAAGALRGASSKPKNDDDSLSVPSHYTADSQGNPIRRAVATVAGAAGFNAKAAKIRTGGVVGEEGYHATREMTSSITEDLSKAFSGGSRDEAKFTKEGPEPVRRPSIMEQASKSLSGASAKARAASANIKSPWAKKSDTNDSGSVGGESKKSTGSVKSKLAAEAGRVKEGAGAFFTRASSEIEKASVRAADAAKAAAGRAKAAAGDVRAKFKPATGAKSGVKTPPPPPPVLKRTTSTTSIDSSQQGAPRKPSVTFEPKPASPKAAPVRVKQPATPAQQPAGRPDMANLFAGGVPQLKKTETKDNSGPTGAGKVVSGGATSSQSKPTTTPAANSAKLGGGSLADQAKAALAARQVKGGPTIDERQQQRREEQEAKNKKNPPWKKGGQ